LAQQITSTPGPPLFQSERQYEIVALTLAHGRVEVSELATRYQVTTETIRRDLSELQDLRLLRRVHGGAVAWETNKFEPLLAVRNDQQHDEKRRMAALAIKELPDSGTIIIDSGSTLAQFANAVPTDANVRVVTNSLPIAQTLAEHEAVEVIVIGGKVRRNTMAMVDANTIAALDQFHVDTLFISTDGLSPQLGLTTPYRQEAGLKQAMIRSARRVVALVDHTKFGKDQFVRFAEWSDIDVLITTTEADSAAIAEIEGMGTTVLRA